MSAAPASVLQVRSSAGLYGADRMVLTLNRALGDAGTRSRLLSISNYRMDAQPLHDAAIAQGQDAALLPCAGRLDTRTAGALAGHIVAYPADLVHVHDYKSAFYAWLATRRRPARLVATLHGWVENSRSQRLYHRLEMALLRRFDALVVVASDQAERLAKAGIPRARIHQVDNAIDVPAAVAPGELPALRASLGLPASGFVFGAVGRLSPEKNLGLLLDAFARTASVLPAISLLVVGDGPERAALEARAAELGLGGRVVFAGVRTDMTPLYGLIDCLTLSSVTEGMPLVVLEAMARGIPIVATDVGDIARLLARTDTGQLVASGATDAFAAALARAAERGPTSDESARRFAAAGHFPEAMAAAYQSVYRSILANAHGRRAS
jgi:L-malate glycosyltransferase